ncbi:MAG: M48 family metalloprotease [Rhodospirillales bacterium]
MGTRKASSDRSAAWLCAAALAAAAAIAGPARAQQSGGWLDMLGGVSGAVDRLSETLVTPEQERQIAETEHPKVLAQFGGEYADPAVKDYVAQLVKALGKASDRPDIEYRVTVLNSPVVNAFALPAGYVYATRGLLALCGSEAELAGVMAHEIGHVTARHTAQRYGRSVLASGAAGLAGLLNSPLLQQATQIGGQLWIQSFSRDQEFQADQLGVATMARAGYDPRAMAGFLAKLRQYSELQTALAGRKPGEADQFNLFATHPRTGERVERAAEQAGQAGAKGREERDSYLGRIDGMLYGDDPAQGFVRGRVFAHPQMKFRFEAPEGFQLLNGTTEVTAAGPGGGAIRFDAAPEAYRGQMRGYVSEVWARGQRLASVETLNVNGMEGGSGVLRVNTQSGPADVRLTAIRFSPELIFRFQFVAPAQTAAQIWPEFGKVTGSFRRLSDAEAAAMKPLRLRLVRAGRADSVESLARRMAAPDRHAERFRALNGIGPDQQVAGGQTYKIAAE